MSFNIGDIVEHKHQHGIYKIVPAEGAFPGSADVTQRGYYVVLVSGNGAPAFYAYEALLSLIPDIQNSQPRITASEIKSQELKADAGKLQWSLVMSGCNKALLGIVKVMTIAVTPKPAGRGYKPDSWRDVPDAVKRYKDALHRHLAAIEAGEVWDNGPEGTGQLHADCVATNALFLSEFAHGEHDAPLSTPTA